MTSNDAWIRHMAKRRQDEDAVVAKRRAEEDAITATTWLKDLRMVLNSEAYNMKQRLARNEETRDMVPAKALHRKLFDETFFDFDSEHYRTKTRWQGLLAMCGGDRDLLLQEWTRAVSIQFKIKSRRYVWRIVYDELPDKKGNMILTVRHNWGIAPRVVDGPDIDTSSP